MKVDHIRKVLILIILVLVSHNYSNFTVLSFSSSLTDLVGSRIKQTSFKITIDEMKKLRREGRGLTCNEFQNQNFKISIYRNT